MGKTYSLNVRNIGHRLVLTAVFTAALIVVGIFLYKIVTSDNNSSVAKNTVDTSSILASNSLPESVEGRYMFSGTIVLARAVERAARGDYSQPFSKFDTFNPSQYDGWLADLECPVTSANIPYEQQSENLIFNCKTEWLPEMYKYIKFINLANNHSNDMGDDGFLATQANLDDAGYQIVGNYRPTQTEDNCEVMSLPVRLVYSDGVQEDAALPVGFCAFHYFSFSPSEGELEEVQELAKTMPVFSFMHVGVEYLPTAKGSQVDIAHKLIDYGSEFVIGNSPHWVQNSEVYKDKLIVYSTGNFIFDQLDIETNRGLNMDVEFSVKYDQNLRSWMALSKECQVRNDSCLEKAKEQGLSKYNLDYVFRPVASLGGAGVVTHKADDATQKAVEQRLNWENTLEKLRQ